MSHSSDPKRDELRDRLVDHALREVLGGEAPPDLSDQILAAAEKQGFVSSQRKEEVMDKSKRRYRLWTLCGVAACLLVGGTIALINYMPPREQSAAPTVARVDYAEPSGAEESGRPAEYTDMALDDSQSMHGRLVPLDHQSATEADPAPTPRPGEYDNLGTAVGLAPPAEAARESLAGMRVRGTQSGRALGTGFGTAADWERLWGDSPSGQGPGRGGDKYDRLAENPFRAVKDHPLSTFSIDVDTAAYANVRRFLLQENRLPPSDAVRIEEMINYFDYDYAGPKNDVPFAEHVEVAGCPWKVGHRLVRVGLKGKEIQTEQRPQSNLVFLLDVSGSMNSPDKLPLLKKGMKLLAKQLGENDRVAIVVYASAEGLALPSTSGADRKTILAALDKLQAGGSTAGGAGIELAYRTARENFIEGGVNRVLLCTDGDFNVGTTSTGALVRTVEEKAKSGIFLSVLGFGRGNLNDAMMENISNKGNGNYAYIDSLTEARKVLVKQMGGTLVTIAKDVKIQIDFNLTQVAAYRLIGYENRMLAAEDFNDDKKDAGEIGAGHTVTALYEVVPVGAEVDVPAVDPLKYQVPARATDDESIRNQLLTLKLRYKAPDADTSKRLEFAVVDSGGSFNKATPDFQFAAAVASFGMLLRNSKHKGAATYDAALEIATASKGPDVHGYREQLVEMVHRAQSLTDR